MSQSVPKVEFITARPKLVAGREQTVDVLLRVSAPESEASSARRPRLNLSLVLDRSGSMAGPKMEHAREAACYCVEQLLPTDRLSVVVFDDVVEVLLPSRPVEDKAGVRATLARVFARNSTALHEAWVRGGMQVSEHLDADAINRVLLITDGLANVGVTSTDEIVSQAAGLFRRGVSTSTVGIGADFNEDLLMPMAQSAGGNAWHVREPEDMRRVFSVELEGLLAQFAHAVTLGLVPADGVRLTDLLNDFQLGETGRYVLPDLQAGSPLDIVVQLKVPAHAPGARLRLLDLRLGYTPQEARSAEVLKQSFEVEFDEESAVGRLPVDNRVERAVQLLMTARARREAVAHMDAGRYELASASVAQASQRLMASPAFSPADAEMQADYADLRSLTDSLQERGSDGMTRKLMAYYSSARSRGKKTN